MIYDYFLKNMVIRYFVITIIYNLNTLYNIFNINLYNTINIYILNNNN